MKDAWLTQLTVVALLVGSLAACAPGGVDGEEIGNPGESGETIAVFTKNQTNPFFATVRAGTENAAAQMDANVIQYVPTRPDSIPEQMSQIEDIIISRPDAVVFIPVDSQAMIPGVMMLNAAELPVINITDPILGGEVVTFMNCDEFTLAENTARFLLENLGGGGNVVILEGVGGSLNSNNRVAGFMAALEEFPEVTLLASQPGNFQESSPFLVETLHGSRWVMQPSSSISSTSSPQFSALAGGLRGALEDDGSRSPSSGAVRCR